MTFHWNTFTLAISAGTILVALVVCFISWRRSQYSARIGILELLRLLLVFAAIVTLNQPEFVQEFEPNVRPTVAILYDVSDSMKTEDVVQPDSATGEVHSRHEAILPLVNKEAWSSLDDKMDIVFEPYSSNKPTPEQGTDISSALEAIADRHDSLRAVVLMSDGDWNEGDSPSAAATRLGLRKIPVYAIPVGSEDRLPDLNLVDFKVPAFTPVDKPLQIPYTVESTLPRDAVVQLRMSAKMLGEESAGAVAEIPPVSVMIRAKGRHHGVMEWRPGETGPCEVTLTIEDHEADRIGDNNQIVGKIDVRDEALRVLVIDTYPRWEYRYLRNALERDPGVEVNCFLKHPDLLEVGGGRGYLADFPADDILFQYHVVFLGDIGIGQDGLTIEQCGKLKQFVSSQAGGLVFLPGLRGKQDSLHESELNDLLPVEMNRSLPKGIGSARPAKLVLTDAGRESLLTRLESDVDRNSQVWRSVLPGFHWHAAVQHARPNSLVLATHGSSTTSHGRIPLIVTRTFGVGKVLYMGTDEAWRWREGYEDLYHYRYWGRVVRWMAYKKSVFAGKTMRLMVSNDQPLAGDKLRLDANVMSTTGEPLQDGVVMVQAISPSGKAQSISLQPGDADLAGLFSGSFTPEEAGEYQLHLICNEAGEPLKQTIDVRAQVQEKLNRPAKHIVLRDIAKMSRGGMKSVADPQGIIKEIASLPEPEPIVRRVLIWSHPIWGGLIIGLLCLFWIARKMTGLA